MNNIKCTHCNLSFSEDVMIEDGELRFCCKGCQGVYHLLKDEGLGSFYDKLGDNELNPVNNIDRELEKFDLEGFERKYIKINNDGLKEIHLIIEGIHCSACVWLNEKVLHKQDGIIEASINYTNNKAKVVWDSDEIKLSRIIEVIRSIGYNAYPYDPSLQEEKANATKREYYSKILVGVFGTMNIMWIAIAQYAGYFNGMEQRFKDILNVAEFILATPVLFYSGWVFFRGAYFGLRNRIVNMDILVASGALSAYIYSIYAMVTQIGETYFESVVMIITFVLVGKYLEVLSKKQAVDKLDSIIGSTPSEVMMIKDNVKSLVSVENIKIDDIIEVKSGEKIVIDGDVISGGASFDESSLTGEGEPIYKQIGDKILSGTICLDSTIRYKATKDASNSLLSSIASLLEESLTKKPEIEKLADRVSGYFSTIILLIGIITFGVWYGFISDFEEALIVSISVIVIACPCALGLATPMSTLVGISIASSRGLLFKEASFLESMAKANLLALDKTGTITEGKPQVVDSKIYKDYNIDILYSLLKSSNHPISRGVAKYLEDKNPKEIELEEIKNIQAKGIKAKFEDNKIIGGNIEFMRENGVDIDIITSNSLFIFAINNQLIASFELQDKIRDGAKEAINNIKNLGVEIVMLTGDHKKSASRVAKEVGITKVYSKLLPQGKLDKIEEFHQEGKIVVMAGDGINDSLALASSDISISMGSGADISLDVSDVILLDDKPQSLYEAFVISKRTFRGVKENLGFSIVYNIITVPLAVMGFVTPLIAALSMSLSSLIVVLNSMRIKYSVKF
ncbi:Lead, cadmium, zinc and mercury transporting ATPase; Copper-translocating P-type ATPase [hydrothermal vent metagenome]|uniref:Lead, cadmium, zinc and mercury transporting ATPase Copper-translocating P-type ATPase n=1 Tax=hydrothermal vent metagenome TaxID=652676 RepID=A0A1W1EJK2_9ZZZZ